MKKTFLILCLIMLSSMNFFAAIPDSLQKTKQLQEKINISGVYKGEIKKDVLLNSKGLSLDDKISAEYKITRFKMTVEIKGQGPLEFDNQKNGTFSKEMFAAIKNAPPGSKMLIEYIQCVDKNDVLFGLPPVVYLIK